jgi:uncharacterized protein YbjQ (UPF0145 family)
MILVNTETVFGKKLVEHFGVVSGVNIRFATSSVTQCIILPNK